MFRKARKRIRIPNTLAAATALVLLVTAFTEIDDSRFADSSGLAAKPETPSASQEARQLATETVTAAARPAIKASLMLFRSN